MSRSKKTDKAHMLAEVEDLRRARPTKRILEQVRSVIGEFRRHSASLISWCSGSELAQEALGHLRLIVVRGDDLVKVLEKLDASGFSPPRKCYTAATGAGDTVMVLEEHRDFYADLMDPTKMADLKVLKKQPGKGGGLVVEAKDGSRMRVAIVHVVRTS